MKYFCVAPDDASSGPEAIIDDGQGWLRLAGALDGIRVLEMGSAIAGPLCAALLGDMGADVVKVEAPGRGDDARRYGELVKGESPYFLEYNRNKRSLAVDIKKPEGREVLLRLMGKSDVLVENFRPGTMERLGLSYGSLRRKNPGLVYCSVSGFGQTGPYSQQGGYDAIIQAMCGLMSVTGEPGGEPLRVGVPITDITAALNAAYSVTLALFARTRTGRGQRVDVSLFESGILMVSQWMAISALTGKPIRRFGNRYPLVAPYELFEASDGPFVMAVGSDSLFAALCRLLSTEELLEDPRFRTNEERIKKPNRDALTELLQARFRERTAGGWVGALRGAEIPAGTISSIEDLLGDEHLASRGDLLQAEHSVLGRVRLPVPLPKLSGTPGRLTRAAPVLGQHTRQVLSELGYRKRAIASLYAAGVVG